MDAMCAGYMERNSVALEDIVAVGIELGVFVLYLQEFLGGAQVGLMDVKHAEQVMEGHLVALEKVVNIGNNPDVFVIKGDISYV